MVDCVLGTGVLSSLQVQGDTIQRADDRVKDIFGMNNQASGILKVCCARNGGCL